MQVSQDHRMDRMAIETPTKKNRGSHENMKTADSASMAESATKNSIADINAEELFDNFSRIVTVTETNEPFESEETYRQL